MILGGSSVQNDALMEERSTIVIVLARMVALLALVLVPLMAGAEGMKEGPLTGLTVGELSWKFATMPRSCAEIQPSYVQEHSVLEASQLQHCEIESQSRWSGGAVRAVRAADKPWHGDISPSTKLRPPDP